MPDDKERKVGREIEVEYRRLETAIANKDLDAFRQVHAPEYSELQIDGEEHGLDDVISEWQGLDLVLEPSFSVVIDRLELDGAAANVTARTKLTFVDSPLPGMRQLIRDETVRCDRWIGGDGAWRLCRSQVRMMRSWINDKLRQDIGFEPPSTAGERASLVHNLRCEAMPFKSVLAGSGFDDLAGLDGLVGDARIVALGEASHGTAEFFQMKHRLLEYLVEHKGFSVFAIEGNWPEANVSDRFVKTGEGDAAAALAAMYFWTWRTEEVRDLLDWMRTANTMRGDRAILSFAGFDMQFVSVAIKRVADLLGLLGDAERKAVLALYEGIEDLEKDSEMKTPPIERTRLRDNAGKALARVDARREALIQASTPEEYRDARQAARIVCQASAMHAGTPWAERDAAMAENVRWLFEAKFPGQKIVLWAHNGHVATAPIGGERSMGMHLRELYGDEMVVIGFASHHGEVRAKRIAQGKFQPGPAEALRLAPARKASVEALFQEAGLPRFVLDLRRIAEDTALGRWIAKPRPHRSIGAGFDPDQESNNYIRACLPDLYDAIIFVSESTAAKALR